MLLASFLRAQFRLSCLARWVCEAANSDPFSRRRLLLGHTFHVDSSVFLTTFPLSLSLSLRVARDIPTLYPRLGLSSASSVTWSCEVYIHGKSIIVCILPSPSPRLRLLPSSLFPGCSFLSAERSLRPVAPSPTARVFRANSARKLVTAPDSGH